MSGQLFNRIRVRRAVVELRPRQPVAPFDGIHARRGVSRVELAQDVDVVVRRHAGQDLRGVLGRLGVHVAPPVDRLDAAVRLQSAVVAQDASQLSVDAALDHVVRRRQRPLGGQLGVEVREQGAVVDQPHERAPRFPQPLVGVLPAPVDPRPLFEEVAPEAAPAQEPLHPQVRLPQGPYAEEILRQAVQLDSRQEPGPGRRAPFDLAERMVGAPLHPGGGPFGRRRGGKSGPAVGDHHLRRGDGAQQRPPRRRRLPAGEVPGQDVLLGARDEYAQAAVQVYAVHKDDAVDLVHDVGHGPDLPEALRSAPEGPPLAGHGALGILGKKPTDEGVEVREVGTVGMDRGGAATPAAPPLRPRARAPVPLHRLAAGRADLIIHGITPEKRKFLTVSRVMSWGNAESQTHFLSE